MAGLKRRWKTESNCELLVVDEASMVDVMLMQALLKPIPNDAALLIVGDINQLPSVGPDQVLADIIGTGAVPMAQPDRSIPSGGWKPDQHDRLQYRQRDHTGPQPARG
jgi:ATP-dependent exoDNAse (exonuclease V) alpha subunit